MTELEHEFDGAALAIPAVEVIPTPITAAAMAARPMTFFMTFPPGFSPAAGCIPVSAGESAPGGPMSPILRRIRRKGDDMTKGRTLAQLGSRAPGIPGAVRVGPARRGRGRISPGDP
ncbi:hypothetical protein GCM10023201_51500 [Actinomycetospora corticicola]